MLNQWVQSKYLECVIANPMKLLVSPENSDIIENGSINYKKKLKRILIGNFKHKSHLALMPHEMEH